jgi:hypothetical protein
MALTLIKEDGTSGKAEMLKAESRKQDGFNFG